MKALTSAGRLLATMTIAATILGLGATQAYAKAATPDVGAAITVSETSTTGAAPATAVAAAAAEKCWYHHSVESGKLGGTTLWTFEQIVNWCGKSGKVTRITSNRVYFSHTAGSISITSGPKSTISKPSSKEWIDRSSATVHFCILKVGCVAYYHPWIEAAIYGNGTRSSAGGF